MILITIICNVIMKYTGTSLHFGTLNFLITEVSSIQRSFYTLQYYTGTQNRVLITEVSTFQRFVIERFHCNINSIIINLNSYCILPERIGVAHESVA